MFNVRQIAVTYFNCMSVEGFAKCVVFGCDVCQSMQGGRRICSPLVASLALERGTTPGDFFHFLIAFISLFLDFSCV